MKLDMDTIKFENRLEIVESMDAIARYTKQHPENDNKTLKNLYRLLEVMYTEW